MPTKIYSDRERKPDEVLLRAFVGAGDSDAFRALVERHAEMVFSVALRRAGQWEIAQEASQNAFRALALKAAELPKGVVVGGWLHRAALFEARNLVRAEATRARITNDAAPVLAGVLQADGNPDAGRWEDLAPVIDGALDELPVRDRDLLLMRFYEGLSYKVIGRRVGKNESSARKHTLRALDALAKVLKRHGVAVPAVAVGAGIASGLAGAAPIGFGKGLALEMVLPKTTATATALAGMAALGASVALVAFAIPVTLSWYGGREAINEKVRGQEVTHQGEGMRVADAGLPVDYRPDLDTIFRARGSQRLLLLARWLPGASGNELAAASDLLVEEKLGSAVNHITPDPFAVQSWSLVFARWSEVDPQGMLGYVAGLEHERYGGAGGERLLFAAYRAWGSHDPEAALGAARGGSAQNFAGVVAGFQKGDPERAIDLALGLPAHHARHALNWSELFAGFAGADLQAAAAQALTIGDSEIQGKALDGLLRVWAGGDAEAALELVDQLEGLRARETGRETVLRTLAESDPMAAMAKVATMPAGATRAGLVTVVGRKMAADDPAGARAWAEGLPSPADRRAGMVGVALALAESAPSEAASALDALGWDLRMPGEATTYYPGGSMRTNAGAHNSLGTVAASVVAALAESDPGRALGYAARISGDVGAGLLTKAARRWAAADPAAARQFVADEAPGDLRDAVAVEVAATLGAQDAEGAMAWGRELGGAAGELAQVAVFEQLARTDPARAADEVARIPSIKTKDAAVAAWAEAWAEGDFPAARAWVQDHARPDAVAAAFRPVVEAWSEQDPVAASAWVATLPDGQAMEQAVTGLVGWMINQPEIDHEAAFLWTERLTRNSGARKFYFELVAKDWLKHDPEAARSALARTDLPEDVKARLLSSAGGGR